MSRIILLWIFGSLFHWVSQALVGYQLAVPLFEVSNDLEDLESCSVNNFGSKYYALTWVSETNASSFDILMSIYGPTGNPVVRNIQVNNDSIPQYCLVGRSQISYDRTVLGVTWTEGNGLDGDSLGIFARFIYFNDSRTNYSNIQEYSSKMFIVNSNRSNVQFLPYVSPLSNGNFVFAYQSKHLDGDYKVFAKIYNPRTLEVVKPEHLVSLPPFSDFYEKPKVTSLPTGDGYIIAYVHTDHIQAGGIPTVASYYNNGTRARESPFRMRQYDNSTGYPEFVLGLSINVFLGLTTDIYNTTQLWLILFDLNGTFLANDTFIVDEDMSSQTAVAYELESGKTAVNYAHVIVSWGSVNDTVASTVFEITFDGIDTYSVNQVSPVEITMNDSYSTPLPCSGDPSIDKTVMLAYARGFSIENENPVVSASIWNYTGPTHAPTDSPTVAPTGAPSDSPSTAPTPAPSPPTSAPTVIPTAAPTESPTLAPTLPPTPAGYYIAYVQALFYIRTYLNITNETIDFIQVLLENEFILQADYAPMKHEDVFVSVHAIDEVIVEAEIALKNRRLLQTSRDVELDIITYVTDADFTEQIKGVATSSQVLSTIEQELIDELGDPGITFTIDIDSIKIKKPTNNVPWYRNISIFVILLVCVIFVLLMTISCGALHGTKRCSCLFGNCFCKPVDNVKVKSIVMWALQVWDLLSDVIFTINVVNNSDRSTIQGLVLAIAAPLFVAGPYFANLWAAFSLKNALNQNSYTYQWFSNHSTIFSAFVVASGGAFASLGLVSSRLFGIEWFDCGLSESGLDQFRSIRIYYNVFFENIPQLVIQLAFVVTNFTFDTTIALAFTSSFLSIVTVVGYFLGKQFHKTHINFNFIISLTAPLARTETDNDPAYRNELAMELELKVAKNLEILHRNLGYHNSFSQHVALALGIAPEAIEVVHGTCLDSGVKISCCYFDTVAAVDKTESSRALDRSPKKDGSELEQKKELIALKRHFEDLVSHAIFQKTLHKRIQKAFELEMLPTEIKLVFEDEFLKEEIGLSPSNSNFSLLPQRVSKTDLRKDTDAIRRISNPKAEKSLAAKRRMSVSRRRSVSASPMKQRHMRRSSLPSFDEEAAIPKYTLKTSAPLITAEEEQPIQTSHRPSVEPRRSMDVSRTPRTSGTRKQPLPLPQRLQSTTGALPRRSRRNSINLMRSTSRMSVTPSPRGRLSNASQQPRSSFRGAQ